MKNKKGFTLVELLAVIVILAVIALIAIPIVINVIGTAKKGSFKQSLFNIEKAAETYRVEQALDESMSNGCKYFSFTEPTKEGLDGEKLYVPLEKLQLSGELPTTGEVEVCNDKITVKASDGEYYGTINQEKNPIITKLPICKRAETLHTETCSQTDTSRYCSADGYTSGETITYGSLGESGILSTGDAFDCDVNGDGTYDAQTERFYYVTDLENNPDYAVLVYYNNVSGGEPSNSTGYAYDISGNNNNGPVTAIAQLPTTSQWSNVSLTSTIRQITSETGGTTTGAGDLPTAFSYEGYAARLLTYEEVNTGCYDGTTALDTTGGISNKCKFLMENTKYSSSSLKTYGGWLESPTSAYAYNAWRVYGSSRRVSYDNVSNAIAYGVRPVIEVLKSYISL